MNEPVTELDQRFSHPAAAPVSWDETRQVLERAELSWIVTVRADGRPHVILMTGRSDWDAGLDVVVEGDAVPVTDNALLTSLAAAWTAKWDGRWQYQARDGAFYHEGGSGTVLVFAVKPGKALAFAKGSFSQTRYTFA